MAEGGSLSGVPSWPDPGAELRANLLDAVVALVGERGLRDVTLQTVVERAGSSTGAFYRFFDNLDLAFAAAYERLATELSTSVLAAGTSAGEWRSGFRAALGFFMDWVATNPGQARVLLVEHRVAGGLATEIHERVCAGLEVAIDRARDDPASSREPPALAAALILGAIEFATAERVMRGEAREVAELVPSLAYFGVLLYFGDQAADREVA